MERFCPSLPYLAAGVGSIPPPDSVGRRFAGDSRAPIQEAVLEALALGRSFGPSMFDELAATR